MLSPTIRRGLIVIFLLGGVMALLAKLGGTIALAFFATAFILTLGHFRHGPMLSILMALRKGKIGEAEQLLTSIKRPNWLSKRYQAYYFFSNSLVATHRQNPTSAIDYAHLALNLNQLQDKESGILVYNLARMAYQDEDFKQAKEHLATLKKLSIDDLHLKKRIEELDTLLKTR